MKCAHDHYQLIRSDTGSFIGTMCTSCGAKGVRSLGPSNDDPLEVQDEIDAAELGPHTDLLISVQAYGGRIR